MKLFNKVAIVGVGLIGGSIGLGLKKKRLANEIIGVSRHKSTLSKARKIQAIDKGSLSLGIIKDADLVILATPVKTILKLAPQISKIIKKDCLVTDVGSTKQEIVSVLEKIFPKFVGSHPLAGSEKRSVANASPDIFKNSLILLTPSVKTNKKALEEIKLLWKALGARIACLSPSAHDKAIGFVSHLPHAAGFSLINAVPSEFFKFAASGFKDTTRIGASDSELWVDIFQSNTKNILVAIESLEKELSSIKSAIKNKDRFKLAAILKKAKGKRENLA